mmetsp:Transcript_26125/g.56407  ORF Transcript_26125/g.56407 Transcript_26125/m.56407 type:complete len:184 (-) Transcript_26125:915-1466(-)
MSDSRSAAWAHLPLLVAAEMGEIDRVLALIEEGANVNQRTADGWTALIMASKEGHVQVVQALLEAGAEPNPPIVGHTALRGATLAGHETCVRVLLNAKADPNYPSNGLRTALMGAARNGFPDILTLLLQHGADRTFVNDFGETAVTLAEEAKQEECINAFIRNPPTGNEAAPVPATQGPLGTS